MDTANQNGHAIELRDEANRLVGYYVPVPIHAEIQRLTEEIDRLRHELVEAKIDRDGYRRTAYYLVKEFLPLNEWRPLPLGSDGVPLDEVLREFEASQRK
jgi:hypothetical protein